MRDSGRQIGSQVGRQVIVVNRERQRGAGSRTVGRAELHHSGAVRGGRVAVRVGARKRGEGGRRGDLAQLAER